jgi:hypothetical protein
VKLKIVLTRGVCFALNRVLEVLDGSLVSFGLFPGAERRQDATLSGPGISLSRIVSIFSGLEFSDHDGCKFPAKLELRAQGFGTFALHSSAAHRSVQKPIRSA